ncbi:transposable element Tcb1 transposase [Trichonephila clavipes]|nr:transposable element Tcb1 transposase [Trichonephila clavipes]
MSTVNIPMLPFFVHIFLKTTQLSCRRKQFNSLPQLENQNHCRRKTTQLIRRKTTQLGSRTETTQQEKTTQLGSRNETTGLCAICNRLHCLYRLYSRIGFSYLLVWNRDDEPTARYTIFWALHRSKRTRPRKTSLREDRLLLSNRKLKSSQILQQWTLTSNVSVCPRTVRGRLLEIGLRGCKAHPKPLLTKFQRKRRLTWAREHSLWTIKYWEKPLVSQAHSKVPDKSDGMGCCMSSHGVGRLHIVSGTVKAMDYIEILQNKLLPTARDLLGNQSWIFQDDNAPCHRAKVVQKWLD